MLIKSNRGSNNAWFCFMKTKKNVNFWINISSRYQTRKKKDISAETNEIVDVIRILDLRGLGL
jgi:hypothetical protein